jgi:hypothetical protein
MMEIILAKEKLATVLPRWERQYGDRTDPDKTEITRKLRALDWSKTTAAEVEAIIGNSSWTTETCDECGVYAMPMVRFGKYADREFHLCPLCIGKAAVLSDAIAKLK